MTESRRSRVAQLTGVGCFTAFCGFFSGGMTGVLVSKMVAFFTKAPKCADLPTCDWHVYAGVGMVVGAITLPLLVLNKLRRMERDEHGA